MKSSRRPNALHPRFDWADRGYFFDRAPLARGTRGWQRWAQIFAECRSGCFSRTPELVDLLATETDGRLRRACGILLGDAGSPAAISHAADLVASSHAEAVPLGLDLALVMTDALCSDGARANVETVLELFSWNLAAEDAAGMALHLSRMLEPEWGPVSDAPATRVEFVGYERVIRETTARLEDRVSAASHIFLGQPADASLTARLLLAEPGPTGSTPTAEPLQLRRRLEAATGLDCSRLFRGGCFRPEQARSMLPEVAAETSRFAPGEKLFFGHRVQ